MWGNTRVPGEELHRCGEKVQTPHRQWPWPGTEFFSHQCCNKTTLTKTTLSDDLLCISEILISIHLCIYSEVRLLDHITVQFQFFEEPNITSVGEDIKKIKLLYIVDKNLNLYSHYRE